MSKNRSVRYSPGMDWSLDVRLLRGSLKEREAEARRQGVFEDAFTKAERDQEGDRRNERP